MTDLTKTRSVLDVVATGRKPGNESLGGRAENVDRVWFEEHSEPGEPLTCVRRVVVVDRETFADLGEPTQITLTIERGDLLNQVDSEALQPASTVADLGGALADLARWCDSEASRLWNAGKEEAGFALHCKAQGVLMAMTYLPEAITPTSGGES